MIGLQNGQFLYHGSYTAVPDIDLTFCRRGLDFGKGFYLTSSYDQAKSFVRSAVRKAINLRRVSSDFCLSDGIINIYRFHENAALSSYMFQTADTDWLHFVAGNRNPALFPELIQQMQDVDIIGGKVANDNTARTLVLYVDGAYGIPGDDETDSTVIRILLPNRLQDQFCFRSAAAIASLEFVRGDRYGG